MPKDARKFRKHLRAKGFDYTSHSAYFVTICTHERQCVFGEILQGELKPTRRGMIVEQCWYDILFHHHFVELDAFILMPNHVHGILVFVGEETKQASQLPHHVAATPASPIAHGPAPRSLGSVVGSFKSAVSRTINRLKPHAADHLWQTNYYEHVVRNDRALDNIRAYILTNPSRWLDDELNPVGTGKDSLKALVDDLKRLESPREGDAGVAATKERQS